MPWWIRTSMNLWWNVKQMSRLSPCRTITSVNTSGGDHSLTYRLNAIPWNICSAVKSRPLRPASGKFAHLYFCTRTITMLQITRHCVIARLVFCQIAHRRHKKIRWTITMCALHFSTRTCEWCHPRAVYKRALLLSVQSTHCLWG